MSEDQKIKNREAAKLCMRRKRELNKQGLSRYNNVNKPTVDHLALVYDSFVNEISKYRGDINHVQEISLISEILKTRSKELIKTSLLSYLENYNVPIYKNIEDCSDSAHLVKYETASLKYFFIMNCELSEQLTHMVSQDELSHLYKNGIKLFPNKCKHVKTIKDNLVSLKKYLRAHAVSTFTSKKELLSERIYTTSKIYVHRKNKIWFKLDDKSPILYNMPNRVKQKDLYEIEIYDGEYSYIYKSDGFCHRFDLPSWIEMNSIELYDGLSDMEPLPHKLIYRYKNNDFVCYFQLTTLLFERLLREVQKEECRNIKAITEN